jgi:hypothetical protein
VAGLGRAARRRRWRRRPRRPVTVARARSSSATSRRRTAIVRGGGASAGGPARWWIAGGEWTVALGAARGERRARQRAGAARGARLDGGDAVGAGRQRPTASTAPGPARGRSSTVGPGRGWATRRRRWRPTTAGARWPRSGDAITLGPTGINHADLVLIARPGAAGVFRDPVVREAELDDLDHRRCPRLDHAPLHRSEGRGRAARGPGAAGPRAGVHADAALHRLRSAPRRGRAGARARADQAPAGRGAAGVSGRRARVLVADVHRHRRCAHPAQRHRDRGAAGDRSPRRRSRGAAARPRSVHRLGRAGGDAGPRGCRG